MNRKNELLIGIAERFLFHSEAAKSEESQIRDIAEKMLSVEIWEMWVLTQE